MEAPVQIECLAQVIHHEARGESEAGKRAVAQVVLNRTKTKRYPKTICGVVTQPNQFSRFHRGIKASKEAYRIARETISYGARTSYLYFNTVGPRHAKRIGNHYFWR